MCFLLDNSLSKFGNDDSRHISWITMEAYFALSWVEDFFFFYAMKFMKNLSYQ